MKKICVSDVSDSHFTFDYESGKILIDFCNLDYKNTLEKTIDILEKNNFEDAQSNYTYLNYRISEFTKNGIISYFLTNKILSDLELHPNNYQPILSNYFNYLDELKEQIRAYFETGKRNYEVYSDMKTITTRIMPAFSQTTLYQFEDLITLVVFDYNEIVHDNHKINIQICPICNNLFIKKRKEKCCNSLCTKQMNRNRNKKYYTNTVHGKHSKNKVYLDNIGMGEIINDYDYLFKETEKEIKEEQLLFNWLNTQHDIHRHIYRENKILHFHSIIKYNRTNSSTTIIIADSLPSDIPKKALINASIFDIVCFDNANNSITINGIPEISNNHNIAFIHYSK